MSFAPPPGPPPAGFVAPGTQPYVPPNAPPSPLAPPRPVSVHGSPSIPPMPLPQASTSAYPPPQFPTAGSSWGSVKTYLGSLVLEGQVSKDSLHGFDPTSSANAVRNATKGMGTDDSNLCAALVSLSGPQIQVLNASYKAIIQKDLHKTIEGETSGKYQAALLLLIKGPLEGDYFLLTEAVNTIEEPSHKYQLLCEILIGRPAAELQLLADYCSKKYNNPLTKIINKVATDSASREVFLKVIQTHQYQDRSVEDDAEELERLLRGEKVKDEELVDFLLNRSPNQLQHISQFLSTANYGTGIKGRIGQVRKLGNDYVGKIISYITERAEGSTLATQNRIAPDVWGDAHHIYHAKTPFQLYYRLIRAHWDQNRFTEIKRGILLEKNPNEDIDTFIKNKANSSDLAKFLRILFGSK